MASGHGAGIALLAEDSGREGSPATAATALRSPVRDTLPATCLLSFSLFVLFPRRRVVCRDPYFLQVVFLAILGIPLVVNQSVILASRG